jgi:hypothetical protein
MNPTRFRSKTTPWRVQVAGRHFPDRKRKALYFKTEKEAIEFCKLFKHYNVAVIKAAELLFKKGRGQI